MTATKTTRAALAALLATLLIACGGDGEVDDLDTPTPGTAPELTEDAGPVPEAETPSPGASE